MHKVALVLSPGFQVISLAALSAFELANHTVGRPVYDVRVLSEAGGAVPASVPGVVVQSDPLDAGPYDTVAFASGLDLAALASDSVLELVRESVSTARRVASICTGAFVLAQAGVLDGRRVTTHWAAAPELQRRYPQIKVDPDRIFIVDGPIWTSAGASAGVDLALGMVENDLGEEVALMVAKKLVLYHRRGSGQSQHSVLLEMGPKTDRIQTALDFARQNLRKPISVEDLANAANLSPRQFSRTFRTETGLTPAKAIENLRVEAAKALMAEFSHSIEVVASQAGFGDRERMRRAFLRVTGRPPLAMRRAASPTATEGRQVV